MKKDRIVYGLLTIVLTALIVLAGTWIPEALLERKAETFSSGKAAVVDRQEITPYTYTMSVETRIPKLTDFIQKTMDAGMETCIDVREPLDTELTRQQALEKTKQLLQTINEIYENWGLDTMFPKAWDITAFEEISDEGTVAPENSAGTSKEYAMAIENGGETGADAGIPAEELSGIIDAFFVVDPSQQQISLWWLWVIDSYGNTVYVAMDAVTGLPVLIQYMAGYEATLEEYALAVSEAYTKVYGAEYTFSDPVAVEKLTMGYTDYADFTAFDCQGKFVSLEYQYYFNDAYYKDYQKNRPGNVMVWLKVL